MNLQTKEHFQPHLQNKPKKQRKKRTPVFMYGLLYFFSLVLIIAGFIYYNFQSAKNTVNEQEVVVEIPKGSNADKIEKILKENGVLDTKSSLYFKIEGIRTGLSSDFKAGKYAIPPKQSVDTLMQRIAMGDSIPIKTVKVTIPEGYTLEQIASRLESNNVVSKDDFLKAAYHYQGDEWFLNGIPVDEHRLDGFLYPDTYEFYEDMTGEDAIKVMLKQFGKVAESLKSDFDNQDLSIREIITIASLIEKEAKHDEDRPKIASVIYNRLAKNMLLQIDATVLYAVGHKEKVTYDDLEVDSPYNTYKYKGLPPSPIANPGKKSIEAALKPEKTDYLYYVADKETGYHHFAKTLKEHENNIKKYLR